ncbi:MAG: hypothetical protein OHK0031_05270 [Anaerolineales bacterium]
MSLPEKNFRPSLPWLGLAFALALVLRLLRLGELPLSDAEAAWALQALHLLRAQPLTMGANPLYVHLTALFFFIFQPGNAAARLLPALAGSFLVFLPGLFGDRLSQKSALLLAFLLACDPGLLALSRQAGSLIPGLTLALFAWGFWRKNRADWAGIFAGLALLSGPALWGGLLALALALGLTRGLLPLSDFEIESASLRRAGLYALGAFLAFGSFFLLSPGGLGAAFRLPLENFFSPGALPPLMILAAPLIYQPLALIFGLMAALRGLRARDPLRIFLGLWWLAAWILALLPIFQPGGLAWAQIPLLALAALELADRLIPFQAGRAETLAMAALTVLLLTFVGLTLTAAAIGNLDATSAQLYGLVALAALLMLAISVALVAQGWNTAIAWQGAFSGGLAVLAAYTLSAAFFSAQLKPRPSVEIWADGPSIAQAAALENQMNELSLLQRGAPRALDVTLVGFSSPALEWLLRDWPLSLQADFSPTSSPALMITPEGFSTPQLESAYRGADFRWRNYPGWGAASFGDWTRWLVEHSLPSGEENLLLWARADLFSHPSQP